MNKNYDIGIIGSGVAGTFAALRLAEKHKNKKVVLFDLGRPPGKRRRFLEGYFGCFPTGDGKVYTNDLDKVLDIADGRRAKSINKWFTEQLQEVHPAKLVKSKLPNITAQKRIKEAGFDIETLNYTQWKPENIHQLSRIMAERIEDSGNVCFNFDNEVMDIIKQDKVFMVSTNEQGDFHCKKLILCVGRSGWRWVNELYRKLGILIRDDIASYGVTIELSSQYMKDLNKSHFILNRDDMTLGPFSWGGSIIQEDHADLTVAAFRSNEDRWKSDKVSFSLIGHKFFKDEGCKQTDRLAKLVFLLSGDRVGKEKVRSILRNTSQLSLIPEYSWLPKAVEELDTVFPSIISRGYFHYPNIIPLKSEIKIGSNLETEIPGLFVAGESAGIKGIAAAGITGAIAAESACK